MNPGTVIATRSGPEDLAVVRLNGREILFTATAPRQVIGGDRPPPAIESYAIGEDGTSFQVRWEDTARDFNPTGIAAIADASGTGALLHVTCADDRLRPRKGRVCVFHVSSSGETRPLWQTPWHRDLSRINGIATSVRGDIYVSTFRLFPRPGSPTTTELERTPAENSIYHFPPDRAGWRKVAVGINGANGLALSADETHLLVCAYHDKSVLAFRRDPASGGLAGEAIPVRSGLSFRPDNLKATGGYFCVAGQRSLLAAVPNSLFGLPTSQGGGELFEWAPGHSARRLKDLHDLLSADWNSPSVALPVASHLYVGHIVAAGVRRFDFTVP